MLTNPGRLPGLRVIITVMYFLFLIGLTVL